MMQQPSGGVHPQQVPSDPQQQYQQAPQQYAATQNPGSDEIRSLWIGDSLQWMDEAYILSCFGPTGEAVNILQTYNGTFMPNTEQNFRLNRATLGADKRRQDDGPDFTVFVGDLAADVIDYMLQETFRQNYHSVKGARVVTDRTTAHQVPNPSSFHFIP
ncbi:polyadenylate-binding protein RBP45C-like [Malus sylvestris]|uniref:polyadenylate-binding protein RBP45C-like n=1 Tax=Malus sylvestris TaxID=3752 RepID=UPI0021AC1070|nr:polyadenylate-binding protein RBP45C-like [Malus sylvestris]